jgi:signal transduction histidine kinase
VAGGDQLEKGSEARRAGVDRAKLSFDRVERRRTELWTTSVFVVAAVAAAVVFYTLGQDLLPEDFRLNFDRPSTWVVLVLLAGLGLAFVIYIVEKERSLRRLSRALVEERVLSAALSNRLAELSRLSELGKAVNSTLDLQDVLNLILSSALELLGGTEGSIMLVDEAEENLIVAIYQGPEFEDMIGRVVPTGGGISGMVVRRKKPLLVQGSELGGELKGMGHPDRSISSAICVPLIRQEETLGVLNLNETIGEREFTDHDVRALEFFAEHAAVAIANARQYEKEREAVARLEELDRLKSDFVATVSHELKTPLTAIIGAAKTLGRSGRTMGAEKQYGFIEMIDRQGGRLLRLVEDVLTTARIESGTPIMNRRRLNLREAVGDIIEALAQTTIGEGRQIVLKTEPDDPHVWGDPTAIHQIVMNLLENALKYSPPEKLVRVTVRELPAEAVIAVVDEGQGIPEEQMETIFDRFRQLDSSSTRRVGGVGLGLFIVKRLVDAHGGRVEVESTPGRGSTFMVRFPKRAMDRVQVEDRAL